MSNNGKSPLQALEMKTFSGGACRGPDPLGCKHSPLPTSLPDILKPIGHKGYNKYSKGFKNALSGNE